MVKNIKLSQGFITTVDDDDFDNISKYKGVTWSKKKNKWQARIHHDKKTYSCGYHNNEEKANQACIKKRKELNII